MPQSRALANLQTAAAPSHGVFSAHCAADLNVGPKQLLRLTNSGVIERVLPGTYRFGSVPPTFEQAVAAALVWAGPGAAAAGRSAAMLYKLDGITTSKPEIALPHGNRKRHPKVQVYSTTRNDALNLRQIRGLRATGIEATLVRLAYIVNAQQLEIVCEDARRRRLTTVAALGAYLNRFGEQGHRGVAPMRRLLKQLDPTTAARSTLEVITRRLLVDAGLPRFTREFPLVWRGRRYFFDFCFEAQRTILETNGRRWHDDPNDYEHDNEKWSVAGRHGYKLVFATWNKVTTQPDALIAELTATLAA